jgi:hypothetical protein
VTSRNEAHRAEPYVVTTRDCRARHIDPITADAAPSKPPDAAIMPAVLKTLGA